jgi:uncharacterized protein YggE
MTPRPILLAGLASLAAAALALSPAARAQAAAAPALPALRTIHVTGEGHVTVSPDVAVVFTGAESTGPDLARVTKDAAARMRKVLSALEEAGIPQKDVQTTSHDVRVERPWQNGKPGPITGYTVSDQVRVTVRELARLGPAIDKVTAAGANSIQSLSFQKDDPAPERARALAAAYGVARAKAEALARAAGVTLGEVLQLDEAMQGAPRPVERFAMARAVAGGPETPIATGELEITASVEVTYAIR